MKNLACAIAVLLRHREARHWTDEAVAADLMIQLGLDPNGTAANASLGDSSLVTLDQLVAADDAAHQAIAAARDAQEKLHTMQLAFDAQNARTEPEVDAPALSDVRPTWPAQFREMKASPVQTELVGQTEEVGKGPTPLPAVTGALVPASLDPAVHEAPSASQDEAPAETKPDEGDGETTG